MLFTVNPTQNTLEPVSSDWAPSESELEKLLITTDEETPFLNEAVFGEPLLIIRSQVRTRSRKRADILAIDQSGYGVVVELKRDQSPLGVETQALQYLADFSNYKGDFFIRQFAKTYSELDSRIRGFLSGDIETEKINQTSRIILVARRFDPTIFSMGEWLSGLGVPFRCIEYTPVKVGRSKLISFSIAFDRSPTPLYPLRFASRTRLPAIYWHNIGSAKQEWWEYLTRNSQIPASFENSPGDQGERLLRSYITGDRIVAYAKGFGAVGWGIVDDTRTYRLVKRGSPDDLQKGLQLHRLKVRWKAVANKLEHGLCPKRLRDTFDLYHPVSTSVRIRQDVGQHLCDELSRMLSN